MRQAWLVDGVRTPFLKVGKVKKAATDFALAPVMELHRRYNDLFKQVDCVICANIGNQILAPDASNLGRVIALNAGIPQEVPAWTVNINCASGLHAVADAVKHVELGLAKCALVVGVEVMSDYALVYPREQRPLMLKRKYISRARMPNWQKRLAGGLLNIKARLTSHDPIYTLETGLTDPVCHLKMDEISDRLAEEFKISREELDLFALESQRRAATAQRSGRMVAPSKKEQEASEKKELVAFEGFDRDNGVRLDQDFQSLAKLKPIYRGGVTTAGNSSQVTDGAVALIVASDDFVKSLSWPKLAKLSSESWAAVGCDPAKMGLGPVGASFKALSRNGWKMDDVDLIETNEAFAAVVLAQQKMLGFDFEKTNINGGAIALGHPLAASGTRLVLTMAIELRHRKKLRGLATLCVGGGQGEAMVIERM